MAVIDEYIADLDAALRGPRRTKADLLREAHDSLLDASEAYEHVGLRPDDARRRAVDDFGAVSRVAPDYQSELAVAQGRRTAQLVLISVALQPVIWKLVWSRFAGAGELADAGPYALLNDVVDWLGAVTIAAALLAVAAFGIGIRRLGVRPRYTRITGIFAFAVAAVFTVSGLLLTALKPEADTLSGIPFVTVFLLVPMAGIAINGVKCFSASQRAAAQT